MRAARADHISRDSKLGAEDWSGFCLLQTFLVPSPPFQDTANP